MEPKNLDPKIPFALRIGLLAVGLILLYCASLYEDQSRKLVSALEVLWIRIDELRVSGMNSSTALLRVSTRGIASFSEKLFGQSLFSFRSISVALVFPLLLFFVQLGFALAPLGWWQMQLLLFLYSLALAGPACCIFFAKHRGLTAAAPYALLIIELLPFLFFARPLWSLLSGGLPGMAVGAVAEVAAVAVIRLNLRWCAVTGSASRAVGTLFLNAVIILAVLVAPLWCARRIQPEINHLGIIEKQYAALSTADAEELLVPLGDPGYPARLTRERERKLAALSPVALPAIVRLHRYEFLESFSAGFVLANLSITLIALSPILLVVLLLVYRLAWPVLGRIVYPFSQFGVMESRGTLATVGFSLTSLAIGPGILTTVLKALK